jgi:hypothetical protein
MVKLAGNEDVGTFTPDQLYAGEADIVTTQGVIEAATAAMLENNVVALVADFLVPYNKEGVDGSEVPYGVLPHAIDNSAGAADVDTPVIVGGVLNFDALVADGATYAVLKAAFANSNIVIQKLY